MRKKHPGIGLRAILSLAVVMSLIVGGGIRTPASEPGGRRLLNFTEAWYSGLGAEGELIVKYGDNAGDERYSLFESGDFELIREIPEINAAVIKLARNGEVGLDIYAALKKYTGLIAEADINRYAYSTFAPNDGLYKSQGALSTMNIEKAWDISTGADVLVAVLDSGVTPSHPDMQGRISATGYDFVSRRASAVDETGHGTLVAGIIAANGNNKIGIAGVNWNARVLPVKVLDSSGKGSVDVVASGIIYAADRGAKIINMSLVCDYPTFVLKDAIDYACKKGVILVAATGNEGKSSIPYPARYDNVIAVGSGSLQGRQSYSNYGPGLTVLAVGSQYSTSMSGGYSTCVGTSFSAPIISGILSLAAGIYPDITQEEAMELIRRSVSNLGNDGYDYYTGWGLIDLALTLQNAREMAGGGAKTTPSAEPSPSAVPTPVPTPSAAPVSPPAATPSPVPDPVVEPSPEPEGGDKTFSGKIGDRNSERSASHEVYVNAAGTLTAGAAWAGNGKACVTIKDRAGNTLASAGFSGPSVSASAKIASPGYYSVTLEAYAMNNTIKYTLKVSASASKLMTAA